MVEQVKKIIANFQAAQERRYGTIVGDLQVIQDHDEHLHIQGSMLSSKQQKTLDQLLRRNHFDPIWEIGILSELSDPPLGWGYAEKIAVPVWSRIVSDSHYDWFEAKIKGSVTDDASLIEPKKLYLATQIIVKDEPIKLLAEATDFFCIQLIDQTIGWVKKRDINRFPGFPDWQPPLPKAATIAELKSYLDRWLGVPYLLGGETNKGIDCSGLVQVIYRHLFNFLLPRHSMDQMHEGKLVEHAPRVGDLAFFEHQIDSGQIIGHVGLVLENNTILHACRFINHKVAIDKFDQLIQGGYKFLGYRQYPVELLY